MQHNVQIGALVPAPIWKHSVGSSIALEALRVLFKNGPRGQVWLAVACTGVGRLGDGTDE